MTADIPISHAEARTVLRLASRDPRTPWTRDDDLTLDILAARLEKATTTPQENA